MHEKAIIMKSKYRNIKTTIDGIKFDSKKEAERYKELKLLERAGEIKYLQLQKEFVVVPESELYKEVVYKADFVYTEIKTNKRIIEDVKGYRKGTAYTIFKIKQKLMYHIYGLEVVEI